MAGAERTNRPARVWDERLELVALGVAILVAVVHQAVLWDWLIEDAAISFSFARHLADGRDVAAQMIAAGVALRQRDHVLAARALGCSDQAVMRKHLLPLVLAPVWVEASFGLAGAVIAEAGLSFLGLGIQPPDASWGGMIRDGVRYLLVAPHLVLAPGVALFLVVLAANMLGDGLRDHFDVTSHSTR